MGHLFDSPVQVPCLPIALQQLSVATCTNWQPPGANSGDFCLNHIDSLETDDVYPQNPIKIWSMPKKCGIVLGARNWKWSWCVLAYCVLWCIMLLMDAYGGIWFGPPNLSWLTLQWLRYTRQSAPPPPRGRLWYAPVCDLQGSEGHATPKQITKPVELLRHDSTGWNMPRTHAHTLPSPLSLYFFPAPSSLSFNGGATLPLGNRTIHPERDANSNDTKARNSVLESNPDRYFTLQHFARLQFDKTVRQ